MKLKMKMMMVKKMMLMMVHRTVEGVLLVELLRLKLSGCEIQSLCLFAVCSDTEECQHRQTSQILRQLTVCV